MKSLILQLLRRTINIGRILSAPISKIKKTSHAGRPYFISEERFIVFNLNLSKRNILLKNVH